MKIQFQTLPVSKRLHGWKRIIRFAKHLVRGTLVIDLGRKTREFAN